LAQNLFKFSHRLFKAHFCNGCVGHGVAFVKSTIICVVHTRLRASIPVRVYAESQQVLRC
jgi:hypothetical protein